MAFDSKPRHLHWIHQESKELVGHVADRTSRAPPVVELEPTLLRQLVALGAKPPRSSFVQQAATRPEEPVYAPGRTRFTYQDRHQGVYPSAFGKIRLLRHYLHTAGRTGICPLDGKLRLLAHRYSDLFRYRTESCATDQACDTRRVLKPILGLSVSTQALETAVLGIAADFEALHEQKAVSTPAHGGAISVNQADGKGGTMVHVKPTDLPPCQGKGQKRTENEEAVERAVCSIQPLVGIR